MNNVMIRPFTVTEKLLNDAVIPTVNARDLHERLEIGRDFAHWIQDQIESLNLQEHVDYEVFVANDNNPHGGRPKVEYFIPLDIAKHIGMASRTQKGREVRDYFIELEKIYSQPKELTFADVTEFLSKEVKRQRAELRAQQLQIAQLERSQAGEEQQREQLQGRVDGVEEVLDLVVEHITTQFTPAKDWIHANDPIFRPSKKNPNKRAYDTDAESTQAGLFSKWVLRHGFLNAENLEIRKEPLHGSMTMVYPPWFMAKYYPQFKTRN